MSRVVLGLPVMVVEAAEQFCCYLTGIRSYARCASALVSIGHIKFTPDRMQFSLLPRCLHVCGTCKLSAYVQVTHSRDVQTKRERGNIDR